MATSTRRPVTTQPAPLHILDPAASMDLGIAVVSAAAGAASQWPRIQSLERELSTTRAALTESEQEMVAKIHALEEKLHVMDTEYEAQTDKFKKQYDLKMRDDLAAITEKMKTDFGYKLEIRLAEEKSKLLAERMDLVSTFTGGRQEELLQLKVQRDKINKANVDLEKALEESQKELERLHAAATKKGWWPF